MKKRIKQEIRRQKNKKCIIKLIKYIVILGVPIFLTAILSASKQTTYEFVDEENRHMVAPAQPFPYIPQLFSDVFLQLGMNCYNFCIENDCYSKEHSLPMHINVKMANENKSTTIYYNETKCYPIFKEDVFYDVAPGGFVISDREWMKKHFKLEGDNYKISFKMTDVMNYKVYAKLTCIAQVAIYLICVGVVFGLYEIIARIFKSLTGKRE